jgi:hypothetical protein
MEAENISKARGILNIQKSCNVVVQSYAPVRIQTPPTYDFAGALSEITLLLPACDAWDPRLGPSTHSSGRLHRILSGAFYLKLSTLKSKFY